MTISVRLNEETKRLLAKLARSRRTSRSEVVRQAIRALAHNERGAQEPSLYDRLKGIIGSVHSGRSDLSQNTGEHFYKILLEKKRQGRL